MSQGFAQKFAAPMFSIGLLSLVLGIFTMAQSPSYGATKPVAAPTVATQTMTLNYLGWTDNGLYSACGYLAGNQISSGYQSKQSLALISNFDGRSILGDSLETTKCQVTFKVVK